MTNQNELSQEIINTLNEVVAGRICEVRILRTSKGVLSGYFDNPDSVADAVVPYDGKYDIYVTLNEVKDDLFARGANRLVPYAKNTTADADITRRMWLLIDIDPVRPAGVSATAEEKKAAGKVVKGILKYLVVQNGWSKPIIADSGNGYHLLFPIDLPNDAENSLLLKQVLQTLSHRFSDEKAKVDETTYNAARICKLYGTMATKGDSTVERPHRPSKILSFPEEQVVIPREKMEELVKDMPRNSSLIKGTMKKIKEQIDVDDYLEKHGIGVVSKSEWNGGYRWVLDICPWNPEHTDHSAFVIQFADGGIAAKCHHNGCSQENWRTLRDKLEPNWRVKESHSGVHDQIDTGEKETNADILVRLAAKAELFHTPMGEAYATIPSGKINVKIQSDCFKNWLIKEFYNETQKAVSSEAYNQAVALIKSKACIDGAEKKLHFRVAKHQKDIYYDLAVTDGRVIKISEDGYEVVSDYPNIFRRIKNMKAQCLPASKGDALLIKNHIQSKTKSDEILLVVTLISSFIPDIAHPVFVAAGEKGAAKSTTMRMVRSIIDPAQCALVALPNKERDLVLTLANNYVPSFDNVESISSRQSDLFCMASTGGGVSTRKLYTDDEDIFLEFKHCVSVNGINVVATRPDLLDRAVIFELERIPEEKRKEESAVWEAFNSDLPVIMAGIFETLSKALALYPSVSLEKLPRMADYCRWGYAIAEVIGYGGKEFLDAYKRNISRANSSAISEEPVAAAIVAFMRKHSEWEDNVAKLLTQLEQVAYEEKIDIKAQRWPKAAHTLSARLNQIKSNLEDVGITFEKKHNTRGSIIRLKNEKCSIANLENPKCKGIQVQLDDSLDDLEEVI